MFVSRLSAAAIIIFSFVTFNASVAQAQFHGLVGRVPSDANAIVMLDADKIMASPLARRDNWSEQRANAAAAGLTILPPNASQFVMAARIDLEYMHPTWEVSLARMKSEPSMPKVAAKWGGKIDRVAERNAVRLPDDSYVVQLGPANLAARRPANRQEVARWLRQTNTTRPNHLSPYLNKAVGYVDELGTPIIMALDIEGITSAESVRERLEEFEALKDVKVDLDALAATLASAQGITLGLNVNDRVSGAMIIDFGRDAAPLKDIAKQILLEILGNQSAMIDEFQEWKASVSGQRVRVSGSLGESGFKRVLSILDAPTALQESQPSQTAQSDPQLAARLASQQFFKSISGLIDDLRDKPGKKTTGQVGMWWERYADKIDKLPLLNVDEELLEYQAYVSDSLREGAYVLSGVGGKARVRQANAPAQYRTYSRYNSFGYSNSYRYAAVEDYRLEAQNKARIRTEERTKGVREAQDIMKEINSETAAVRRSMTKKYNAEF